MDVQVKAGCLVHAIAADDIAKATQQLTEYFRESVNPLLTDFASSAPSAEAALELENALFANLRQLGLQIIQWTFSRLEPETEQMPRSRDRERLRRRLSKPTA